MYEQRNEFYVLDPGGDIKAANPAGGPHVRLRKGAMADISVEPRYVETDRGFDLEEVVTEPDFAEQLGLRKREARKFAEAEICFVQKFRI